MPNDTIPTLEDYSEATLDAAFTAVLAEARQEAAAAYKEAFRLHWLGRKQGRLKLIGDAWLKSAPAEARKLIGQRFNQLKDQIEGFLAEGAGAAKSAAAALDI